MSKTKEVQQQMMAAMKAKDAERKAALSLLLSALKAKAKDKREDLTEEEENAIIQKEIKQTRETMEKLLRLTAMTFARNASISWMSIRNLLRQK